MTKPIRFYRSHEGALAGVCKGLGEALEIDTGVVRILFILFTIFGGSGLVVYVSLIFSLPRKDTLSTAYDPKILGVCGNLSQRFDIEVGIIRFLALFSAGLSFGLTFIAYIVLYFLTPEISHNVRDIN